MTDSPTVVALCGSLADASGTRTALQHALAAAADRGADTHLVDLRNYDLPLFDADDRDKGDVDQLQRLVREADAVVLGTPVYHGSYSSPLKTALDYCGWDEFEDTTVGLLAVAGGRFPTTALEHLRTVVRSLHGWPLPRHVGIPNSSSAFADGELVDEAIADRVTTLGEDLVTYAGMAKPLDSDGD